MTVLAGVAWLVSATLWGWAASRPLPPQLTREVVGEGRLTRFSIRVTNEGPAEAREIDMRFPDGGSPVPEGEAKRKLPIPVLQPGTSVDITAAISFDTVPPFHAELVWRDGLGDHSTDTTLA